MEITVLKAICQEISSVLPGLRLVELGEGPSGEIFLAFRGPGGRHTLLISPRPGLPRAYLTGRRKPPHSKGLGPFAQSLGNRILGTDLVSIVQTGLERAVLFHFSKKKGDTVEKSALVFEMAGKKPGLILLDEKGKILLAQSYVPISDEALRPILPGLVYQPPPKPDKLDPNFLTEGEVERITREDQGVPLEKALFRHIGGISPLLAAEAKSLSGEKPTPGKILNTLKSLLKMAEGGPYKPLIYYVSKGPVLSAIELKQFAGKQRQVFISMSEAAESFYDLVGETERTAALKNTFLREVRAKLHAARKKQKAIESDFEEADKAGEYQLYGNLLMASLGSVPEEAESVELVNLFSEKGERVLIPLDPKQGPVKNAEACFKKAKKAKAAVAILEERLAKTKEEVKSLTALLEKIERAEGPEELLELKGAPAHKGKRLTRHGKAGAEAMPEFPRFVSSDGYEVLYGKNARQNDLLTFKVAEPMDLWLHAQGYHGSHVIVRNPGRRRDIPLQTILEAAEVAAYFSEARKGGAVPVDYTFRKYVRKPRDPMPGQAVFTGNKTVFVEPRKREV